MWVCIIIQWNMYLCTIIIKKHKESPENIIYQYII